MQLSTVLNIIGSLKKIVIKKEKKHTTHVP
ncbi:hypothetical protein SAMN04488128_10767 [Chitinophaga eiseniae]|uniref:Uncharacterized protein n=1 Tax=Chitinophaga eiseniae TaxID=634771 RepID=A0A1T4TYY7_9BACT|nr:hypothetical protein SAMN04488128_10767 [Chitinophaga eiseniae]